MDAPPESPVSVAIVGAGAIGRGWAALCASRGWATSVFDQDARAAGDAAAEIARRAEALVALGRADAALVAEGLQHARIGRSLLHACGTADWVIEAAGEHLPTKQRLFENIEQIARPEAILTSSSSGLPISAIAGRCRDAGRCVVAHPLNPPEIIPLVEVVPGASTAPRHVDTLRRWLRALGSIPVTLKREVPGNAVGRIAAAVWRECIDLVLNDVIDVEDIDRVVSLGPALGWAAAGPHLTYHLGAGEGGVKLFLDQLLQAFETWWGSLAHWDRLEPEQARALTAQVERAYGTKTAALSAARDRRLVAILTALESARQH